MSKPLCFALGWFCGGIALQCFWYFYGCGTL
jgi:hypothetical protein